jgi:hypothetical protein
MRLPLGLVFSENLALRVVPNIPDLGEATNIKLLSTELRHDGDATGGQMQMEESSSYEPLGWLCQDYTLRITSIRSSAASRAPSTLAVALRRIEFGSLRLADNIYLYLAISRFFITQTSSLHTL